MKLFLLAVSVLVSFSSTTIFADEVYAGVIIIGDDPGKQSVHTAPSGSVSSALSGNYSGSSATTAFGTATMDSTAWRAINNRRGYTGGTAKWTDTFTVQPDVTHPAGSAGTALLTFHLSGSIAVNVVGFTGTVDYRLGWDNNNAARGYFQNTDEFLGDPIANWSTFTRTINFNYGSPTTYDMFLSTSAQMGSASPPAVGSGSVHMQLIEGAMSVLDNASNPIAYSSTSGRGAALAYPVTNGMSFAGIALTNSTGNQTTVKLLGGVANTNCLVTIAFNPNTRTNDLVSDIVDVQGTGTNKFVLQVSYDPLAALINFVNESAAVVTWLDPSGKWKNAVEGNSDGGTNSHRFLGAYNPLQHSQSGDNGADTNTHTVWAVLDHNSRFAAGRPFDPNGFKFATLSRQNTNLVLNTQGPANNQLIIETSTNLFSTNWTTLGFSTLNTNGTGSFTDTNGAMQIQKFYRARQ